MAVTDAVKAGGTYASRLVESDYARDSLTDALDSLRAARKRASGKKPARIADDKKLYAQVRDAAGSLRDASRAVVKGKEPPKRSWGKRIVLVAVVGGGLAVAMSDDLRKQAMGLVGAARPDSAESGGE
jgi:hypothetical protein